MILRHALASEFNDDSGLIASLNPTRPEDVVAEAPRGSAAAVDAAATAAAEAFPKWAGLSGAARAGHLEKWAQAIESRLPELAAALVREIGKPAGEAAGEARRCVAILRYNSGEAVRPVGQVIPALTPASLQFTVEAPLGPVGLITPWNFPLAIPLWKAAPALAAGCTVVLKPSELSPFAAHLLAETAAQAGMPEGVFQVVYGDGAGSGEPLVRHPAIRAISFTGSRAAGAKIAAICAELGKKCQTEMGGKNAAIVRPDANLDQAASLIAGGAFRFAGQKCTATSRVIVHPLVKAELTEKLMTQMDSLALTDPAEAGAAAGPVIDARAHARLNQLVETETGRIVHRVNGPDSGYFAPYALVDQVDAHEELAQTEHFGPVLALIDAADLDEAIFVANATPFGLSAAIFTQNIGEALAYAHRIQAGLVRVNGDTTGVDCHSPFGGVKASSSGSREQGPEGRKFYTEIRTVQINP